MSRLVDVGKLYSGMLPIVAKLEAQPKIGLWTAKAVQKVTPRRLFLVRRLLCLLARLLVCQLQRCAIVGRRLPPFCSNDAHAVPCLLCGIPLPRQAVQQSALPGAKIPDLFSFVGRSAPLPFWLGYVSCSRSCLELNFLGYEPPHGVDPISIMVSCVCSCVPVCSSDEGKQQQLRQFTRNLQFVVVHNKMDFAAVDMASALLRSVFTAFVFLARMLLSVLALTLRRISHGNSAVILRGVLLSDSVLGPVRMQVRRCACVMAESSPVAKHGVAAVCTGCI